MKKLAVVLISGGMDSALCIAKARQDGFEVAGLHLNYAQRTEKRELSAFEQLCNHYEIKHKLVVDIGYLKQIGGSSLTDHLIEVDKSGLKKDSIPSSYVPFRNGNIIAIAASWAEVIGAEALYIGAMQMDSSGYPDCRQEFIDAMENAVNLGTKPETNIKIIAPLMNLTKKDIVLQGTEKGVPFELTWSCYQESETACGQCESCLLRLKGFSEAGVKDPIQYQ